MAQEVREIYRSNRAGAGHLIESYLEREMAQLAPDERLAVLERICGYFKSPGQDDAGYGPGPDLGRLSSLFSVLLGKEISDEELLSADFMEKMAEALDTVFNSLNSIMGVMDSILLGSEDESRTIRKIIGANLSGDNRKDSLQNYLNKIREAFLISHNAFKQAAQRKFEELLTELNPEKIASMTRGGLKFGFFRKAELFDLYKERFRMCREYLDSGRLMEDLSRDFEKVSQKSYGKVKGSYR